MRSSNYAIIGTAVLAASTSAGCRQADPSQVAFVREVYQDEIHALAKPEPGAIADVSSLFSRPVQDLQRAAKAGAGPKLDGPVLHAFFGWHITPASKIALKDIAPSRNWRDLGKVSVGMEVDGTAREVTVTVSEDCWAGSATVKYCIDDVRYENGASYRAYLGTLSSP